MELLNFGGSVRGIRQRLLIAAGQKRALPQRASSRTRSKKQRPLIEKLPSEEAPELSEDHGADPELADEDSDVTMSATMSADDQDADVANGGSVTSPDCVGVDAAHDQCCCSHRRARHICMSMTLAMYHDCMPHADVDAETAIMLLEAAGVIQPVAGPMRQFWHSVRDEVLGKYAHSIGGKSVTIDLANSPFGRALLDTAEHSLAANFFTAQSESALVHSLNAQVSKGSATPKELCATWDLVCEKHAFGNAAESLDGDSLDSVADRVIKYLQKPYEAEAAAAAAQGVHLC